MSVRHGLHRTTNRTQELLARLWPKTVRAKIVALLLVPVVSLMVLWASATVSTVQSAWTLRQLAGLNNALAGPVNQLVTSLQDERAASAQYLAQPTDNRQATQRQLGARTDTALSALRTVALAESASIATLAAQVSQRLDTLVRDIGTLRDTQKPDWPGAFDAYTAAIEDAFAVDRALADAGSDPTARVAPELGRIAEMLARQDTVALSAQVSGRMTAEEYRAFANAVGGQQVLTAAALPDLSVAGQAAFQRLSGSAAFADLVVLQHTVLGEVSASAAAAEVDAGQWQPALTPVEQAVGAIETDARAAATASATAAGDSALTQATVTVLLGLLAVLVALVISVRVGRGLVTELVGLRDSALELAGRRLPAAMRRLRAGERIDIAADVPVVPPGEGEIGEVGDALNAVQRAALQAAAERAELLTGVSGVFVNLARRSQSLVHRQLSLLDTMERRTEDAADLEDLFRLDHLAARMRRHAEGLIIMSGATPGRTWSKPVPLLTVLRSAVAEVEDYARVEVHRMSEVSVLGGVVADLTHLVSELVENATSFSPPNTSVLVRGEAVGAGFAVEIEDRGLGMRPEAMAEANRRIADAHRLDLFDSDRLGLFVVSRLANRQGITVTLRRSPYGGTTAVVLLPKTIITRAEDTLALAEPAERVPVAALATRAPAPVRAEITLSGQLPVLDAEPVVSTITPVSEPVISAPVDISTGGLPRRRRQASLAPGLRSVGAREPAHARPDGPATTSPEQARALMTAFQQGLTRGRES